MIAHQIFAQIHNEKVMHVGPAFSYNDADRVAKIIYGDSAFAVDCTQYPCQEGDSYHDGFFFRPNEDETETRLEYLPTYEQQLAQLQVENAELTLALADMIGGVANVG